MLNGFRLQDLKNAPFPPPGPFPLDMPLPDNRKTLQISMFTAKNGRGLGQMLFELSALFGISKQLGRVPTINRGGGVWNTVTNAVTQHFPVFGLMFEMTDIEDSAAINVNLNIRFCCKFEDPRNLKSIEQQHLLLNGVYFQSFKYFHDFQSEIRMALTPPPDSALRAELMLPADFRDDFIICVHTKRPMIQDSGLSKPSDPIFTRRATDFLVSKYKTPSKRVTVVIFGNDPIWSQNLFHGEAKLYNTYFDSALLTLGLSAIDDVAFSRNFCDSILLTAPTSSFGWWLGYLAKDTAEIYFRDPKEAPDQLYAEMRQIDYYPNSWNKLRSSRFDKKMKESYNFE
ncbi:hypothetical protein GCK72_001591 [Caenorhabditis remanei]|uniref:Uncharacterized protein n=1 Tax=Caenorhabditis remanei TaxID=31234 RepID=A0A6A5HT31_CAERE|nr:hypothetical protein GCK72_001591 [Caenorhabditis remanei]KAF1769774.1 hypothetical protein GCK72_001591 [Caenorhabditis remanei]